MRVPRLASLGLCILLATATRAAEVPPRWIAARTELHPIQTLTLSDRQFLSGDGAGKAVTVVGELRIAQGTGRLPVVVLQHGSAGYSANIDVWSRELNEMGISTFAMDGFTGRGLVEVNSNQEALGRLNLILDLYRSLAVLAAHPRVDSGRIALMGFSRGGQAALYASLTRFQKMWNRSGIGFAAYLPFYPDCMTTFIADTDVSSRPIRIFGGALDDYNPISACKEYVERLRKAGRDVELTEYPTAAHAFDNPLGAQPPAIAPSFQSARKCMIREEAGGVLMNAETGRQFSYQDSCVQLGPHLGHDPAAAQAARTAVKGFLKTVFRL